MRIADRASIEPHRAGAAHTTRTPTSSSRRCSWSPTGWAAPRRASSRRASTVDAFAEFPAAGGMPRTPAPADRRGQPSGLERAGTTRRRRAWARPSRPRCSTANAWSRPRRRLARLPPARRLLQQLSRRPLAGRASSTRRAADARGGGGASATLGDHPRARRGRRSRSTPASSRFGTATSCCSARTACPVWSDDEAIGRLICGGGPLDGAIRRLVRGLPTTQAAMTT